MAMATSLLLALLLPALTLASIAVHDAEVTVRSVRSIVYGDTQISLFRTDGHPDRLFHQPLSFLDTRSLSVQRDSEMNRTLLYLDILLWTQEFVQLAEVKFPNASSIELMPLTHIQLTWSKQAAHWLGEDINDTYHIVADWHDGDKPQMRTTFAIECLTGREGCLQLLRRLNVTGSAAPQLLDLRYLVRGDRSEFAPVLVFSNHILDTPTYRQHLYPVESSKLVVSDSYISRMIQEAIGLVSQNLSVSKRELLSSDVGSLNRSLTRRLYHYFHRNRLEKPFQLKHYEQLVWPHDSPILRPNTLAAFFNKLLVSCKSVGFVKLRDASLQMNSGVMLEVRDELPAKYRKLLSSFFSKLRSVEACKTSVDSVLSFAAKSLGSSVLWDSDTLAFKPGSFIEEFYIVDKSGIQYDGVIAAANLTIRRRFSEHADPVRPMKLVQDSQMSAVWQTKFADSFCILANSGNPPSMKCTTIGFMMPEKSLKIYSNFFDGNVDFEGGSAGRTFFAKINSTTFKFSMRICCTDP